MLPTTLYGMPDADEAFFEGAGLALVRLKAATAPGQRRRYR
jgi:hypothetical protein